MKKNELLHRFRSYLTENGFGPGDKLPGELELAESFGTSRGDIREVLMHFSHLGVLVRVKKRGTFIREVPYEHLQDDIALCFQLAKLSYSDLLEARIALEQAVVPLFIRRINRETVAELRKNIAAMEAAEDNPEQADSLDRDFHLKLFEVPGNSALKIFSNVLYTLFRKEFRKPFQTVQWVRRSAENHRKILDAMEAGDEKLALTRIMEHLSVRNDHPEINIDSEK